MDKWTFI